MVDPNPNPNSLVDSDIDDGLKVFPPDNKFPSGLICPLCGRNQTKKVSNPRVICMRCDAHLGMVATLQKWREKNWREQCTCIQQPTIKVMISRAAYKCKHCPNKWSVDNNLACWEGEKQQRRRRRGKAQPPATSTTTDDEDELHQQQPWQEEEQEVKESSGVMEEEDEIIRVTEEPMESEMEKMHKEMTALRLENERLIEEYISLRIENEICWKFIGYFKIQLVDYNG